MTTARASRTNITATEHHPVTGLLQAVLDNLGHSDLLRRVLHADVALHVTDRAITLTITPEAANDNANSA